MNDSVSPSDAVHRFQPLLISLVVVLVASPLLEVHVDRMASGVLDSMVLLTGVWAMTRLRWITLLIAALGAIALVLFWLSLTGVLRSIAWWFVVHSVYVAYLSVIGGFVLVNVMKAESISADTIRGGICVYLLIGVLFGVLYSMASIQNPEALAVSEAFQEFLGRDELREQSAGPESTGGGWYLYFSFATLTTLGYGDITPVSTVARTLTSVEAVVGPLYMAILIARLVGMHASSRIAVPPWLKSVREDAADRE